MAVGNPESAASIKFWIPASAGMTIPEIRIVELIKGFDCACFVLLAASAQPALEPFVESAAADRNELKFYLSGFQGNNRWQVNVNGAHDIMISSFYQEETVTEKGNNDRTSRVESFSRLYDAYFNYVFRYIDYRIHDPAVVADLTSAVFEKALNSFHKYDKQKAEPQTWLITIARNTVIDYYRSAARHKSQPLETLIETAAADPSPEEQTEANEEKKILKICYSVLQEREQEIVSMKFGAELTNRRIASVLKLSETNIGAILFRAIRKLRSCFQEWLNGRG
jgi:RNA polymerase sigma factor (sigma-70 family)